MPSSSDDVATGMAPASEEEIYSSDEECDSDDEVTIPRKELESSMKEADTLRQQLAEAMARVEGHTVQLEETATLEARKTEPARPEPAKTAPPKNKGTKAATACAKPSTAAKAKISFVQS